MHSGHDSSVVKSPQSDAPGIAGWGRCTSAVRLIARPAG